MVGLILCNTVIQQFVKAMNMMTSELRGNYII